MDLERFLEAQQNSYTTALAEISSGKKRSHWMWYIFPQLKGLGLSETARFYGLDGEAEAAAYLAHPVLGARLAEISGELLKLEENNPHEILGSPDDNKLQSCMTLFAALPNTNPLFGAVLDKYYAGVTDKKTLGLLGRNEVI